MFFVSLAPLQSVESIEPTVATALGLSFQGAGDPRERLLSYLREKNLVLILDNFEHLLPPEPVLSNVEGAGDRGGESLVADMLKTAPHVKILATSRVGLKVRGEHLFPVTGMGAPRVPSRPAVMLADVDQYDAVKLFMAGARRAQPAFEFTDDNLADAVRICHLVGGMPLGIVMAAAWVGMLTPAEIGDEIFQSLDSLEGDRSDVPERQRSMRAVFDHSWNLLTERQCEVFAALSVFRGGFTRQAALFVSDATLRELKVLVDRSLVHLTLTRRYEVHELLRQYAADKPRRGGKLDEAPGAGEAARDRHCAYYIAVLKQFEAEFKGPFQRAALAELNVEIENARTAWNWGVARRQVERLGEAVHRLCGFYVMRSRFQEMETACEAALKKLARMGPLDTPVLNRGEGVRLRAGLLRWLGAARYRLGQGETGRQLLRRSLPLLEDPALADQDIRAEKASALWELGYQLAQSDAVEARRCNEQSLALFQALGDHWGTALPLAS